MPGEGLSDLSLDDLLRRFAARTPAPGGGSAAAVACAIAAALVEMALAYAPGATVEGVAAGGGDAAAAVLRAAAQLRARGLELAALDLGSYEPVLEALRLRVDDTTRAERLESALASASAVPLQIAELAAEIAELGAQVAQRVGRHLVGDAVAGVLLAEAGCRSAVHLIELNVGGNAQDAGLAAARGLARRSAAARDRALATET
ncbi:MAG: cyclodeaminase/cyclohydrolase family protein [Solirubrobacteraceae bacterium]